MSEQTTTERLSTLQISEIFNIPAGTLAYWRFKRVHDKRMPRYHKLITGRVFYFRAEFEADLKAMEVDTNKMVRF